ncbi:ATP-dependent DNA helicase DinG [Paenisporosarcina sp. OV554]|uniref:ATP-dependent DNA helicase DinG n=1 Tax=Paenisporosarcina sp. OV554 TaxID=2135694 RepID=UPI000D339A4F|nr:ATP-dependent DNA helicase DinG [Paenisporosarcina sp. OV554]PUB10304.1 ATP-dependent DNA helicase DinG [Paenisporosarcina sp. OV554]
MRSLTYAIVDIETTGHSPAKGDRMIQFAVVFVRDWKIQSTYSTFIQPGKKIPLFIQDLTNISDEDVKDAPVFEEVAGDIYDMLENCVFVAHNTNFDLSFVQAEFKRIGFPLWKGKKMDTVELSRLLFPSSFSYKLQDITQERGIQLTNAHRADDDAYATAELFIECMKEIEKLPIQTLQHIHKRSFQLKYDISSLFFEALQKKRVMSKQDDLDIYKGIALRKKQHQMDSVESSAYYPETKNQKRLMFSEGLEDFKEREGQFQMMDAIWQTFQAENELAIEASTGIGKTLSYLIPSYFHAKQQGKKVLISTYTSHLMEQLFEVEVPKLEAIVNSKVNVAILKGARHYLDLHRFEELLRAEDESYDDTFAICQILVWLTRTQTGDVGELNVSSGGQFFLDKVRKNAFSIKSSEINVHDFHSYALAQSQQADLLITNHAMLFTDKHRLEPLLTNEITSFIIDEAHQFVQAANARDERIFSFTQWKYVLGQLGTRDQEQLTSSFARVLERQGVEISNTFEELDRMYTQCSDNFDEAVQSLVQNVSRKKKAKSHSKQTILLEELELNYDVLNEVYHYLQRWLTLAESLLNRISTSQLESSHSEKLIVAEWQYWLNEMKIKTGEWVDIFLSSTSEHSIWVELDGRSVPGSLHVFKKPIDSTRAVNEIFDEWRGKAGIIWTSGTLSVPGNSRFIVNQLGLPEKVQIKTYSASSDFYQGANLFIVDDMPDIQHVSQSDFIEAVADAVIQTVLVTEGRCFVLFTSQDMLRKTVDLIQDTSLLEDYMLFAQGMTSGSRMKLLKSFQRFRKSVLFGTNSFWEGVDVPGDALSAVVMVRLPFSSPEEPVFKTQAERLTKQGINSFTSFALPEAILRFRQGFGRLIRSSTDRGVFIVLDRRIESKSYGKEFIRALPDIPVKKVSLEDMVLDLEHWYNEKV